MEWGLKICNISYNNILHSFISYLIVNVLFNSAFPKLFFMTHSKRSLAMFIKNLQYNDIVDINLLLSLKKFKAFINKPVLYIY